MKRTSSGFYLALLMVLTAFVVAGCSSSGGDAADDGGGTPVTPSTTASSLSLSLTQPTVLSDNSDSSTITATVLDSSLAPVADTTVTFSTTCGVISASSVQTDENGQASIQFSSGTASKENQVATITASIAGVGSSQVPIRITGTTITLAPDASGTNMEVPDDRIRTFTVTVLDAARLGIYNVPVTVSIDPSSNGAALFSSGAVVNAASLQANTDFDGKVVVEMTGTGAGDVIVSVSSQGALASITYTISESGSAFRITAPATNPVSLATNKPLTVTVNVPAPAPAEVLFATTFGYWDGVAGQNAIEKDVAGGTASAVFRAASSGVANVQVSHPSDPTVMDTLTVVVSAPSSEAAQISLQASPTVVAPSSGGVQNISTLQATVRNATDQVVGGAPVIFSIENPTGGGETITPAVAYTNSSGVAVATFTSGSLSSDPGGVTVKAAVVGAPLIPPSMIPIVIGGTAGSIVIGQSTHIRSNAENTKYILPMSVQVSDSNGNPVRSTQVTLKVWPSLYQTGVWVQAGSICTPDYSGAYINEDLNRNVTMDGNEDLNRNCILDPGEDSNLNGLLDLGEDVNCDGQLTPLNPASGSLPGTVTTDDSGAAEFELTYLKTYAAWIQAEITASTFVLGSETQSVLKTVLPWAKPDSCLLNDSPYEPPF